MNHVCTHDDPRILVDCPRCAALLEEFRALVRAVTALDYTWRIDIPEDGPKVYRLLPPHDVK